MIPPLNEEDQRRSQLGGCRSGHTWRIDDRTELKSRDSGGRRQDRSRTLGRDRRRASRSDIHPGAPHPQWRLEAGYCEVRDGFVQLERECQALKDVSSLHLSTMKEMRGKKQKYSRRLYSSLAFESPSIPSTYLILVNHPALALFVISLITIAVFGDLVDGQVLQSGLLRQLFTMNGLSHPRGPGHNHIWCTPHAYATNTVKNRNLVT